MDHRIKSQILTARHFVYRGFFYGLGAALALKLVFFNGF